MKIRLLAAAALGLLIATVGCGSEDGGTTAVASGSTPTTAVGAAPSSTTATLTPMTAEGDEAESTPVTSPPVSATPTTALPSGYHTTTTLPAQTLTTLPSNSFTLTFQGVSYYCEPRTLFDDERNDCVRYSGGAAPLMLGRADLYCSYKANPECSKQWYPAELADADLVTIGGQTYVCKMAVLGGNVGDKDCGRYSGGDPDSVSTAFGLKCSPDLGSLQCDDKYYPSEMKGLTQVRIGYSDYLCKSSYAGKQCWKWSSYQSPKSATMGIPDLYCNSSGTCDEDGYPSGY